MINVAAGGLCIIRLVLRSIVGGEALPAPPASTRPRFIPREGVRVAVPACIIVFRRLLVPHGSAAEMGLPPVSLRGRRGLATVRILQPVVVQVGCIAPAVVFAALATFVATRNHGPFAIIAAGRILIKHRPAGILHRIPVTRGDDVRPALGAEKRAVRNLRSAFRTHHKNQLPYTLAGFLNKCRPGHDRRSETSMHAPETFPALFPAQFKNHYESRRFSSFKENPWQDVSSSVSS